MCGIVGILGRHEVAPVILEALRRLEYRGYDSAGIATVHDGRLERRRAVGKLVNLSDLLVHEPLRGRAGIGHTRWATHGAATLQNAHPHRAGTVAVVHNGIIENFDLLRQELAREGTEFATETDTEVIALLAQRALTAGASPRDAAEATLAQLSGAFAVAFLFEGEEDLLFVARQGSPLAIGHGEGEMFVGSDAIALAPMSDRIIYLEEGDRAVITRAGAEIFDAAGRRVNRPVQRIELDAARVEKSGYRHFMAKEIAEQPRVMAELLEKYLPDAAPDSPALPDSLDFSDCDRVTLIACGTAHYACHVAKYWFGKLAGLPCEIDVASEFRYRDPVTSPREIAIFVSQSGETADTLAALRHVKDHVKQVVAVVNVPSSSIAREADLVLPIYAGPEIGVASTKAFTAQLAALALMVLRAAQQRGRLDAAQMAARIAELRALPGLMNRALARGDAIADLAEALAVHHDVLFLGRGAMYPLALEGALKLKEISYIHAEAYAAGELKHGPIALIDAQVPTIVLAPTDELFPKTISNMQEVMARHGPVVLISDRDGLDKVGDALWHSVEMPAVPGFTAPILYALPVQLIAYHTAVAKGTDVDQPRNLAKSVTVE